MGINTVLKTLITNFHFLYVHFLNLEEKRHYCQIGIMFKKFAKKAPFL